MRQYFLFQLRGIWIAIVKSLSAENARESATDGLRTRKPETGQVSAATYAGDCLEWLKNC
jgi:hypothetical protein